MNKSKYNLDNEVILLKTLSRQIQNKSKVLDDIAKRQIELTGLCVKEKQKQTQLLKKVTCTND